VSFSGQFICSFVPPATLTYEHLVSAVAKRRRCQPGIGNA